MKKKLLQYGITTVIGALIALWYMKIEGFFEIVNSATNQTKEILNILCSAFFIPGALFLLTGALLWISTTGFFDSFGYAFKMTAHMFLPFRKTERKSFYDYKMEKEEKRASVPHFVLIVGAAFILVSVVFLILWSIK